MKDISVLINDVKFNYRVGLLIKKDNEILIECNPNQKYVTLPGGRALTLESSNETIIREMKEEMNVEIKKEEINMKGFIENFFEVDNTKYHELYLLYEYILENDKFNNVYKNLDSISNYYKWISIEELNKIDLLPISLKDIIRSNKFENKIINDLK